MKTNVSEINSWYTRLNAIRKKHGLSVYQTTTKVSTDKMTSVDISDLKSKMDTTTTQATYIPDTSYNFGAIKVGDYIKQATKTTIESGLTAMEKICNNCANYSDDTDDVDNTDNTRNSVDCTGDGAWYDGHGGGSCTIEN